MLTPAEREVLRRLNATQGLPTRERALELAKAIHELLPQPIA